MSLLPSSLETLEENEQQEIIHQLSNNNRRKGRRKFLLQMTELFAHFAKSEQSSSQKTNNGRVRHASKVTEKEEDEEYMKDEEGVMAGPGTTRLVAQPSCIQGKMRDSQLEALNSLIRLYENGTNGMLVDEMGLGETLQTISLLGYLHEYRAITGPHMVVSPKSTLGNWMNETKRFFATLQPIQFLGNPEERRDIQEELLVLPSSPETLEENEQQEIIHQPYNNNRRKGRRKFLLQMTELFAHFAKSEQSSSQKTNKGRVRHASKVTEKEEDEEYMTDEEGGIAGPGTTRLVSVNAGGERKRLLNGKMVLLDKLLPKLEERDSRILIFSQTTRLLDILEDYLMFHGYLYCPIDGNSGGEDRDASIESYNKPGINEDKLLQMVRYGAQMVFSSKDEDAIKFKMDDNIGEPLIAEEQQEKEKSLEQMSSSKCTTQGLADKCESVIELTERENQDYVDYVRRTLKKKKLAKASGLLIGMEEVPLEKQSKYLSSLLTPLCQQVKVSLESAKTPSPANIANIQQIIMAINALSKGFSERLDFLPNLSKGVLVIDMFCRVLNSLDDEFISLDYPRSGEEYGAAARIKDSMRQQCIAQIVRVCYDKPNMCANVLDSLRRYIPWIDIGLVANDAFTQLLFELLLLDGLLDQLRAASAKCILAMVSKRMDPKPKLSLLQNLQIRRVFGLVTEDSDSELVSAVASLVTGFATEVLECRKRLNPEDGKGIADELLNEVLPSVFYIMQPSVFNTLQNSEVDTTFSFIQFLSSYVGTMKNMTSLTESQQHHVGQILEGIRTLVQYDPAYRNNCDMLDKVGKEEEERMGEFRKDLIVLLRCIGRVAPDMTQMFIRNSLARAGTSPVDRNVEEVEAALSLFYALGESLNEELMRTQSGFLGDLVLMLLSTRFPCHSNRLVALVYLETISRYMKFVQESTQCIPLVFGAFLDERGIHHPNPNVCQRASYLFMRVVKFLKGKLVPYIETILQSLQDTVARFTSMNVASKTESGSEDGSHIFEAIGLLIGMEEVPLEKQSKYLSSLLTPLCQQVKVSLESAKTPSPANIANIQQIIMAINALSKGFSERLVTASRPAIGLMFKQTLDVLLQILVVFPKIDPLRSKVTSFIHRMVEILGTSVFPYLPKALEQLLTESQPKELAALLVLLNQLICKFSTAVNDILEKVYPTIAGRIFNVLPRDVIPSGPGGVTEEIRELEELQQLFFTFVHVIATHGLSSVFLSPSSRGYLEPTMQLLLYTSCNHKEITVRKVCVQIFIWLIKDWCTRSNGEETVPGFQNFVIEAFAMNCCLYSVLDKSFEFRDANTHSTFVNDTTWRVAPSEIRMPLFGCPNEVRASSPSGARNYFDIPATQEIICGSSDIFVSANGFVLPVGNQGQLKCCWAFAIIYALILALKIRFPTREIVQLSIQYMIDNVIFFHPYLLHLVEKDLKKKCETGDASLIELLHQYAYGSPFPCALEFLKEVGVPYYTTGLISGVQSIREIHPTRRIIAAKIQGYDTISPSALDSEICLALETFGVLLGGMASFSNCAGFRSQSLSDIYDGPASPRDKHGLHGVVILSYGRANGRCFFHILNSYGNDWAHNGVGPADRWLFISLHYMIEPTYI